MTDTAYRSEPPVPYLEHLEVKEKNSSLHTRITELEMAEIKLRTELAGKERRLNLLTEEASWHRVGKVMLFLAVTLFAGGVYRGCFYGSAYGARERANAVREAVRYVNALKGGSLPVSATCDTIDIGLLQNPRCQVYLGPSLPPMSLICDGDEPSTNNGCTPAGSQ